MDEFRLVLLVLLAPLSLAMSAQQESVRFSVTEVSGLARIDGALDFSQLLPGYEYVTNLTVRWNVDASALRNIAADEVPLYVRVTPAAADSWAYFDGGEKSLMFTLRCSVRNGECSPDSVLSRSFAVHTRAPADARYPHDDGIVANASLAPFGGVVSAPVQDAPAVTAEKQAGQKKEGYEPGLLGGPSTGFAILANSPVMGNVFFALLALGAILAVVYLREYIFEKIIIPREKRDQ